MNDDFLRDQLRSALDEHTPDRTAMLNRIAANHAEPTGPRGRFLRLAGSALAVLTVLGLGGVAKWAIAGQSPATPAAPPAVTTPAPAPSSSLGEVATATASPSHGATGRTRPAAPTTTTPAPPPASPVRGHPGDTQVTKGTLRSDGSLVATGRSRVTLQAGADLTELDLTIRVTTTPGLTPGGFESSVDTVTATVEKQPDALLYHFVLRPGSTLTAGTYELTARYGGGARDAADDTYEAYAFSVDRKRIHVYGNFAATR
ncbi:hypothetical protein ODJ79_36020 [Actinoplanes sp. KI2]|uniref:hypothetical protein n=1 Tax=Actinoplanes sp. KI2 TaxID=2983315 RepID=UPI0021D57682|nr:hypothetical protein [Actinoplanes sp. KI2]MCU7729152.1 hypothetical protein [Actinoplanes sp. KI2]